MDGGARVHLLGRRAHLQHGPIDLIVEPFGTPEECRQALRRAAARFATIMDELVAELALLRSQLRGNVPPPLEGPVARRMLAATWPLRAAFITPMAAVAGAVADEVLEATVRGGCLHRAYVNNGGDIAFMLTEGETLTAGLVDDPSNPLAAHFGTCRLRACELARGLATSGWRGRSASLGIADAVTVTAANAATADAAATLVANAVDCAHPSIKRRPARQLDEASDLGELPVTVAVGRLPHACIEEALDRGLAAAETLRSAGRLEAAALRLAGRTRATGWLAVEATKLVCET